MQTRRLNDFTGHGTLPDGYFDSAVKGARLTKRLPFGLNVGDRLRNTSPFWDVVVTFDGGAKLALCVEAKSREDADALAQAMLMAVPVSVRIKRSKA